jgi:hypothetical protein
MSEFALGAKPGAAWSCRWPGQPPARRIRREGLNGVEKDRSILPLGRARAAALGCGLVSGMQCSRLWFPSRWRLSPLFSQDGQILFFSAPISYLGERYLPAVSISLEVQHLPCITILIQWMWRRGTICRGATVEAPQTRPLGSTRSVFGLLHVQMRFE